MEKPVRKNTRPKEIPESAVHSGADPPRSLLPVWNGCLSADIKMQMKNEIDYIRRGTKKILSLKQLVHLDKAPKYRHNLFMLPTQLFSHFT